jgi:serpin B
VVAGNTRFACELYARLRGEPGNLFFSPYSISTALAMTAAAARGETAHEMSATLHLPDDPAAVGAGFRALIDRVNGKGETPPRADELVTANALWLQQGQPFLPAFLDAARRDYSAEPHEVDFRSDTEGARRTINAWVERQTRDKIRDLIGPRTLNADTSLVLTNAIYFKGAWREPFPVAATDKDGTFTMADGRKTTVPMMAVTRSFGYHDGGAFRMVELPYAGGDRSMVVVLPTKPDGLPALEATLTAEALDGWLKKLAPRRVAMHLPRFRVEESFGLGETLQTMGMRLAFDRNRADFSGLTGKPDHFISAVVHKAFVDVNEAGTEAAAATAVAMMMARAGPVAPPVEFRADHPFLLLIRDRPTGSVLFLGRLAEPKP